MENTKTYYTPHNSLLEDLTGEALPHSCDLALDPALQLLDLAGGAPSASDSEPSLQLPHPTYKEKLQQLDPSLAFALEAYPEHAFEVPFMDDVRFWVDDDDDGPARAPDSQALRTAPSRSPSPPIHKRAVSGEAPPHYEATPGPACVSSQQVPTTRKRAPFVDTDHPRTITPHPITAPPLVSPALDLASTKAPLFAPQRPSKKKSRRTHGPTPGIAKRTRHDGTLSPAYPCARCVEKNLECRICYVGGACNTCRAAARKCDLVDQEKKYNSWVDSCRTHKKGRDV